METSEEQAVRKRANELYWGSDDSVNQIADEMDLSKGALYDLVVPLPAGLPCPRCGTEMAYANRTARERGYLTCPGCEMEEEEEAVREGAETFGGTTRSTSPATGSVMEDPPSRVLLGSALLGMAAGIALTLWARRR